MGEKRFVLSIEGMHCPSCAKLVEENLKSLQGVLSAKVDYANELANVETNGSVAIEEIISAIRKEGFDARAKTN